MLYIVISVGLDDTSVVVHESEGTTSVCVTATGIDSDTAVNVTLWVISGTAESETMIIMIRGLSPIT